MAAAPPVKSVVLKTATPTPAQKQLATTQTRQTISAASGTWDPRQDPIVAPAAVAGFHVTRSGRLVGQNGQYARGISGPASAATGANQTRPAPGASPFGGGVSALTAGLKPGASSKPRLQVTVHPSGKIEVQHAAPAAAAPAATPTPTTPKIPASAKGGKYSLVNGRTDSNYNINGSGNGAPATSPSGAAAAPLYGGTSDQAQAAALVKAQLDPLIQQITNASNQRAAAGESAIAALTKQLQGSAAGYAPAASGAFNDAIGAQSVIDQALANRLGSATTGVQGDLATELARMASDPAASAAIASKIGTFGTGAANANFAKGAASLSALVGGKANAADYGAKLPEIATATGLDAGKQLEAQTNTSLADNLAKIAATQPGLVTTILGNLSNARAKQTALDQRQQTIDAATGRNAANDKFNHDAKTKQLNIETEKTLSQLYGHDSKGNLTLAGQKVLDAENKAQTAKAKGNLTNSQRAGIMDKIRKQADVFYYGVAPKLSNGQPVAGTGQAPVAYPLAVARLINTYGKAGITLKDITGLLNSYYQPGEGGRPVFTKAQQAANQVAIPNPFATLPGVTG